MVLATFTDMHGYVCNNMVKIICTHLLSWDVFVKWQATSNNYNQENEGKWERAQQQLSSAPQATTPVIIAPLWYETEEELCVQKEILSKTEMLCSL